MVWCIARYYKSCDFNGMSTRFLEVLLCPSEKPMYIRTRSTTPSSRYDVKPAFPFTVSHEFNGAGDGQKPTSQAITEASEPRPHPACPKQGTSYHTSCIATSRQSGPPFSTMPPVLTQVARASDALPLVATSTPTHNLPITADIQQDAKKLMRSMTTR